MDRAMEVACREELRRAGLPGQGTLVRLLALLRGAPESHLSLGQVLRMMDENSLATSPAEIDRQLQMLVYRGLLGRLSGAGAEPVFDTVPEPHSHLVYEETGQVVDLHVSPETLLAVVRQALAEQSSRVEILVRIRSISTRE
jgi:Fur family iron response transcriptional regulator